MNNDLISREALKKAFENLASDDYNEPIWYQKTVFETIDNAPTVELNESVIQEVLNIRCMTAVANEYLIALHGKRPQGEWSFNPYDSCSYCSLCKVKAPFGYKNFCPICGADMRKGGADNEKTDK